MACGTAVVAVPNPGSREVLDDGRYGRVASRASFGAAILALLDDAPARHALELAGAERAKELSLELMVARYEDMLRRLIHSDERRIATA
jgi:glycosyltransferase involved in cell wall biosynthesis